MNIPQIDGGGDEDDENGNDIEKKDISKSAQQQKKHVERIKRFRKLSHIAIPHTKIEKIPTPIPEVIRKRKNSSNQQESNKISQNIDNTIIKTSTHINNDDSLDYIESSLMTINNHVSSNDYSTNPSILINQPVSAKLQWQNYKDTNLKKETSDIYKKISNNDSSKLKKNPVPSSSSSTTTHSYIYSIPPPIINDHEKKINYQEPYYGKDSDVPTIPKIYANKEFKLVSGSTRHLKSFDTTPYGGQRFISNNIYDSTLNVSSIRTWTPSTLPPSYNEVKEWKKKEKYIGNQFSHENKYNNTNTQVSIDLFLIFFYILHIYIYCKIIIITLYLS